MTILKLPVKYTNWRANKIRFSVSVIIPVLDEEENIAATIQGIEAALRASQWAESFEVIVADNGSKDRTRLIAQSLGATIVAAPKVGYGSACWEASRRASGGVLLFLDGDGSPHPEDAVRLLQQIEQGADLVIGVRNQPEPGSMSLAQRFGNGLACVLLRWLWRIPTSDIGPYRVITHAAFDDLKLEDRAFGWTVEMQVKAAELDLSVREISVRWRARANGYSKVGGTLIGVWRAGWGILGKIAVLRLRSRSRPRSNVQFSNTSTQMNFCRRSDHSPTPLHQRK